MSKDEYCTDYSECSARFESAWKAVRANLTRRARRLTKGDCARADELLSNTALKAYLYMRQSPERIRDPEGFLFLVLSHSFLDSVRRVKRDDAVIDRNMEIESDCITAIASTAPSPLQTLLLQEQLHCVEHALEKLSPTQRQLFHLKFEQDQPYSAIAKTLQVSEVLARKRVELLRKKLQSQLQQQLPS